MSDVRRSAGAHYNTMCLSDIMVFLRTEPVTSIKQDDVRQFHGVGIDTLEDTIADDAHLWLWVTNPFLVDGSALMVARAWGFEPKALCTWVKGRIEVTPVVTGLFDHLKELFGARRIVRQEVLDLFLGKLVLNIGMGHYLRGCTEHLMFCTRGKAKGLVIERNVPNVFVAPRGKHSEKPDAAFRIIDRVSPGPKLSLFERKRRPGYDVLGNEL